MVLALAARTSRTDPALRLDLTRSLSLSFSTHVVIPLATSPVTADKPSLSLDRVSHGTRRQRDGLHKTGEGLDSRGLAGSLATISPPFYPGDSTTSAIHFLRLYIIYSMRLSAIHLADAN